MVREVFGLGYAAELRRGRLVCRGEGVGCELPLGEAVVLAGKCLVDTRVFAAAACLSLRSGFSVVAVEGAGSRSGELVRAQLELLDDADRCRGLAWSVVRAAAENKLYVLEALSLQGYEVGEEVEAIRGYMQCEPETLSRVRSVEAAIATAYFSAIRKCVDPVYGFRARTRRPPRDCFSAALSYANMYLYRYAEAAVRAVGLEPRLGFLHEPFRDRPSLALDLAEEFRQPVVDSALIPLFTTRSLSPRRDFEREGDAVYLSKRGRARVATALRKRLAVKVGGARLLDHIYGQAERLASYLLGEARAYEPFTYRRCLKP